METAEKRSLGQQLLAFMKKNVVMVIALFAAIITSVIVICMFPDVSFFSYFPEYFAKDLDVSVLRTGGGLRAKEHSIFLHSRA